MLLNNKIIVDFSGFLEKLAEKQDISGRVTSLSASSTNEQYPSARLVYDEIQSLLQSIGLKVGTAEFNTAIQQLYDAIESVSQNRGTQQSAADFSTQKPAFLLVSCVEDIPVGNTAAIQVEQYPETSNHSVVFQLYDGTAKITPDGKLSSDTVGTVVFYVTSTMESGVFVRKTVKFRALANLVTENGDNIADENGNHIVV